MAGYEIRLTEGVLAKKKGDAEKLAKREIAIKSKERYDGEACADRELRIQTGALTLYDIYTQRQPRRSEAREAKLLARELARKDNRRKLKEADEQTVVDTLEPVASFVGTSRLRLSTWRPDKHQHQEPRMRRLPPGAATLLLSTTATTTTSRKSSCQEAARPIHGHR